MRQRNTRDENLAAENLLLDIIAAITLGTVVLWVVAILIYRT